MSRRRLQFTLRTLMLLMLVAPLVVWVAHEWRQSAQRANLRREALLKLGQGVMSFSASSSDLPSANDWPNEGQPQPLLGDESQ